MTKTDPRAIDPNTLRDDQCHRCGEHVGVLFASTHHPRAWYCTVCEDGFEDARLNGLEDPQSMEDENGPD